jgi:hypothetical protein
MPTKTKQELKFRHLSPSGFWNSPPNMPPQEGVPSTHSVGNVVPPELSPVGKTNYAFLDNN